MPELTLSFPPPRVPIGYLIDGTGKQYDVLMTSEFARSLSSLLVRVGGTTFYNLDDVLQIAVDSGDNAAQVGALQARVADLVAQLESATKTNALVAVLQASIQDLTAQLAANTAMHAQVAALQARVLDLNAQLEAANAVNARMAALERRIDDIASLAHSAGPIPVDWEHPGKIGAAAANSGRFTTLDALDAVKLNPVDRVVEIKPTGPVGNVTIMPELPAGGQIDNMELGKTHPRNARVVTLNKITLTEPATGATFTLADGHTLTVTNTLTLAGADGATFTINNTLGFAGNPGAFLDIGAGGTLGSAAYQPTTAFAARTNAGLGPAATDPASTQTLANNIRAALLSVGIGT